MYTRHPGAWRRLKHSSASRIHVWADATMLLLLIVLILVLAVLPTWPYSRGWGYYPSGGLGTILLIVIILYFLG